MMAKPEHRLPDLIWILVAPDVKNVKSCPPYNLISKEVVMITSQEVGLFPYTGYQVELMNIIMGFWVTFITITYLNYTI